MEVATRQDLSGPHLSCHGLRIVEHLEVVESRSDHRSSVLVPVRGRFGAVDSVIGDLSRQCEVLPEERSHRASAPRVFDDRVDEPVFFQDFDRLGPVVFVEELDHAAVDLAGDHTVQHQVAVAAQVHHLLVLQGGFAVVRFTSQGGPPHFSRINSQFIPPNSGLR